MALNARSTVGRTFAWRIAFGSSMCFCILPPLGIQGLLLAVAAIAWRASGRGPTYFLKLACGTTLVTYALVGRWAWQSNLEYARLRALYPFESIETRLPAPKADPLTAPLTAEASMRLNELESVFGTGGLRTSHLERLHDHAVSLFIESPGFGFSRAIRLSERSLTAFLPDQRVPNQPGPRLPSTWSPGDLEQPPNHERSLLASLVRDSIGDFVFARGWGYFKDRRQVAGFLPHRFTREPPATEAYTVRTLDLVGILMHDEPVVYVSDHLPAMGELRAAPTRSLDKFESLGLTAVRHGDDLFISRDGETIRMIGAIRSTKQCVACHGGERGDLLGAFSYTLRHDAPLAPDDAR